MKTPGPDHPITIEPTPGHVTVRAGGRVIAETNKALTLREASIPPMQYVPLADVDESLLAPTSTTTHCPYKGDASYYTLTTSDGELTDSVWYYPQPYPAVAPIAGHAAFYPDRVEITVADSA